MGIFEPFESRIFRSSRALASADLYRDLLYMSAPPTADYAVRRVKLIHS